MSARAMLRDKYSVSNNYADIVNTKLSQNVAQTTTTTNIDFDTNARGFREIHLNFIPSTPSSVTEQNIESIPPNVRININIPAAIETDTKKTQHRCNGPNITLSYNKQENLQITISNNSKFKVKKIKQNKFAKLNRIVKLIAFKKDNQATTGNITTERRNSMIQLNLQKILDDNMLYSNQNQKYPTKQQSHQGSKLYFNDNHHVYSCSNESELDAYMRELKSRNESSSDP